MQVEGGFWCLEDCEDECSVNGESLLFKLIPTFSYKILTEAAVTNGGEYLRAD